MGEAVEVFLLSECRLKPNHWILAALKYYMKKILKTKLGRFRRGPHPVSPCR
jgi:hypothetical protein